MKNLKNKNKLTRITTKNWGEKQKVNLLNLFIKLFIYLLNLFIKQNWSYLDCPLVPSRLVVIFENFCRMI